MTYWISKFIPLLFLPLGLSLMLMFADLFSRRRLPLITAIFLLGFFSFGFVSQGLWWLLEYPWQRRSALQAPKADVIVVLSCGSHPAPGPSRFTEWRDPDRFFAGLDLYFAGRARRLLFTGGASPFRPGQPLEGDIYLEKAESFGVPVESMATTPSVSNTAEEAIAIRNLLSKNESRILLVTSAYHMHRAQRLFERQAIEVVPFPVDFQHRASWGSTHWHDPTYWVPSARSLDESSRALRELLGRLFYGSW